MNMAEIKRGRSLTFPLEFMKNSRKEERLESPPWQTEESLSGRGKGKPMQPAAEDSASQGDDGDFLALGPAGALEQEGQLFPLGAFANQTRRPAVPRSRPRARHSRAGLESRKGGGMLDSKPARE
jgi:hypothetical protein